MMYRFDTITAPLALELIWMRMNTACSFCCDCEPTCRRDFDQICRAILYGNHVLILKIRKNVSVE